MSINLQPVPNSAFVDTNGNPLPPLVRWMNAVRIAFAAVPSGSAVQGDIWRNSQVRVALPFAAAGQSIGLPLISPTSTPVPASTNYYTSLSRGRYTTAAGAGSAAGYNGTLSALFFWLGNAANLGGFRVEFRFGVDTIVATTRIGVGLATGALNLAANDPSATLNCLLVGCDSADTTLQVMSNDGVGTATKIDLGASFPIANNAVYRATFVAAANASSVAYTITREDDKTVAPKTGTISADLPGSATFMGAVAYVGNGATAAAASIGLVRVMTEEPPPQ